MMNVNWCASCFPSPLDDGLDATTNIDVIVEKGSSSKVNEAAASESIPTLHIKQSTTTAAEARDDEVHASSCVGMGDNSGREDADIKGAGSIVRPLPAIMEEESLPHSDSIKSIVSAIAADIDGLFERMPGSIGDAAVDGAVHDAIKSTTTVEPTTETKAVSSSSTHRSKLSSKLLSLSACVRNQSTNTNDSPQPSPPSSPPSPPWHDPKEEQRVEDTAQSSNLHLLVSKLWTAQTVDANMAVKQDTTEDNGQCDSSVSKSRTEMIKATNKAFAKERDAKGNKSFVAQALFANAFNAKVQKKKDAKKNEEKGANAVGIATRINKCDDSSKTSNIVNQRATFVGMMKQKIETKMKQKRDTKEMAKTPTANTASQSSFTGETVAVATTSTFSTSIATAAGMLSRLSYDYYQVVIAGQSSKTDMMVRLPYNQQTTFNNLRCELEEDFYDELPKPDYKFCITANFTIGVSRAQESKWRVRDYDLTLQGGDGTYKMPYFIYITKDKGKKEESKVMRGVWQKK